MHVYWLIAEVIFECEDYEIVTMFKNEMFGLLHGVLMEGNMDAPVSMEHEVTTTFIDEGPSESKSVEADYDYSYRKEADNIKDFLAKPFVTGTYAWSTGSGTVGQQIAVVSPITVLTTEAYYVNKIQGFNLVRFTAELTVRINSNPFQQGLIIVHFLPMYSEMTTNEVATRNIGLTSVSQQPHVYLDARDSEVVMRVPYVTPFSWYDIANGIYDMGCFFIRVMDPLQTGAAGITTVDVTPTIRFLDVEFSAPMTPNSGGEETAISSKQSISRGLRSAAKIVTHLGGVPGLSQYCAPTAWALSKAAGVASHFGYSKPPLDVPTHPVFSHPLVDAATSDGVDTTLKLSVLKDNEVAPLKDVTIEKGDEMSYSFLLSREAFLSSATWTTGTAVGNPLFNQFIAPSNLFSGGTYTGGGHTITYRTGPPLWYLSRFHMFYRGDLILRLKFVKTQFHSGRIVVVWQPTYNAVTAPTDSTLCLREIIDIRYADEITIRLPYMLPFTYCPMGDSMGRLSISVLNQLRCPETCMGSIDMLMFWRAADNFEFAAPVANLTRNPPLLIGNADLPSEGLIGGGQPIAPSLMPAQMCVGESITSVKQLTSRFRAFGLPSTGSWTDCCVCPWFFSASTTVSGAPSGSAPGGDVISAIALMYLFFRGSMKVAVISNALGANSVIEGAYLVNNPGQFLGTSPVVTSSATSNNWINATGADQSAFGECPMSSQFNTLSASVPYYNTTRMSFIQFDLVNTTSGIDSSRPTHGVTFGGVAQNTMRVFRSTGDDFQFSYFIGCPPVLISIA